MNGQPADLLELYGMPATRLRALLRRAEWWSRRRAPLATAPLAPAVGLAAGPGALAGRTVATLFFEPSTRTRMSFTIAAQRLGASVVDLSPATSSLVKGETLIDTALTVEAMGIDAAVVRTSQSGGARLIAGAIGCPVINAGDGRHEHPTQGLLDTLAIAMAHGRGGGFDLGGLRVAIVGDVANSRVARSDAAALSALGAAVVLVGPAGLAPRSLGCLGVEVSADLDAELGRCDAVVMLRIQLERHGPGSMAPSLREYREACALTRERAERMKPGAVVLHPGPMNRGVEIDGVVADRRGEGDSPRSLTLEQVRLGVAVRSAVLEWSMLGGDVARETGGGVGDGSLEHRDGAVAGRRGWAGE